MSAKIVHELPREMWDAFVRQHPQGNIFHTPEMFDVWSRTKRYLPELWVALDNDQIIALMMPLRISVWDGWLANLTTRSVIFGDILASPCGRKDGMVQLMDRYREETNRTLFTELRHHSDTSAQNLIIAQQGFRFAEHNNYLVNLAMPSEQVWRRIGKSTRKNIRKAMNKNEFVVEELLRRDQIPTWYALVKKSFKRANVPLADISLFYAAFDILCPKGMAQFLLGRCASGYVAASAALLYKDVIFGWYRGFDRRYSRFVPNDLMVWHLLDWGCKNGYKIFNFGGAGNPNEEYGPRRFKSKFGGTLVNFGRSVYVHHPILLTMSEFGYAILRRLW